MTKKQPDDWLCDDWGCPSRHSCARAFGRSKAYAEMSEKHPPLRKGDRWQEIDGQRVRMASCDHYERDAPRAWLMPQPRTMSGVEYQARMRQLKIKGNG